MLKEKYLKLRSLQEKKRRNEEKAGIELLETKYKASYDKLKIDIADLMQEFCAEMEAQLVDLSGIAKQISDSGIDFSSDKGFEDLADIIRTIGNKHSDSFLIGMLCEFSSQFDKMEK